MNRTNVLRAAALAFTLTLLSGCGSGSGGGEESAVAAPVAKIVVVDKEQCCDCTRERTECTMTALNRAIENSGIPVERLHIDTQQEEVAAYRAKRPVTVIPAVYLLGENGEVIELLQGEVKEEQFLAALGRAG